MEEIGDYKPEPLDDYLADKIVSFINDKFELQDAKIQGEKGESG